MQVSAAESARARRERVRELGFQPEHLTDDEQGELLELHEAFENAAAVVEVVEMEAGRS